LAPAIPKKVLQLLAGGKKVEEKVVVVVSNKTVGENPGIQNKFLSTTYIGKYILCHCPTRLQFLLLKGGQLSIYYCNHPSRWTLTSITEKRQVCSEREEEREESWEEGERNLRDRSFHWYFPVSFKMGRRRKESSKNWCLWSVKFFEKEVRASDRGGSRGSWEASRSKKSEF
jgi:hypothetical protein